MPALRWCGRRWRTSTDDFFLSSFLFAAISGVCGAVILGRTSSDDIPGCPQASTTFAQSYIALGCTDVVLASLFFTTGACSLRGGVLETSKRVLVPTFLYLCSVCLVAVIVLSSVVTHAALVSGEVAECDNAVDRCTVRGTVALNYCTVLLFFFLLIVTFDPSGASSIGSSEEYESLWWRRAQLLFCRWSKRNREDDAFMAVARTFAVLFRGYDLVPSDIVAGMVLLHGYQVNSRRLNVLGMTFPPASGDQREPISYSEIQCPKLTMGQVEQLRVLRMYSKYYLGAYGCLLYQFMNCSTALPKLFSLDPCACCRARPGDHTGTKCFCDVTALRRFTSIPEEDIILTSWDNSLFRPVFYVVFDRETNNVVVAIRGTMSFSDCLTDLVAAPEPVLLDGVPPSDDVCVHRGMKRSADYLLRYLSEIGLLARLAEGDLSTCGLTVLGHSLGAGVATILSILLWSVYPQLRPRLRGLAYSPPGGLLSEAVMQYSKKMVVGCFVGNDLIVRLAQHTLDEFRESILDLLARSPLPKSLIFLNCVRPSRIAEDVHPCSRFRVEPTEESTALRGRMREQPGAYVAEPLKMYPPATLVYFVKVARRQKTCCGFNCSCFPGLRRCLCCNYREEIFVPAFVTPQSVQTVICSSSMMTDHFPDRLLEVLNTTLDRLERGELDRFMHDDVQKSTSINASPHEPLNDMSVYGSV